MEMTGNTFHRLITGREFESYLADNEGYFEKVGIEFSHKYCEPTDNSALVIDFDTKKYIARITVWESGECDIEALYSTKEGQALNEHYEFKVVDDFYNKISELVRFLIQ